jgi:uncharacterized protein YfdQ (DUF2303 family)
VANRRLPSADDRITRVWWGEDDRLHVEIIPPHEFYIDIPQSTGDTMTDFSDATTEAEVVATLSRLADDNLPAQIIKTDDGRVFGIRRNDVVFDNLTPAHAQQVFQPKIVTAAVQVQTAASLSDYVNRFKNEHSVLFANINANSIVAAIDYHNAPKDGPDPVARLGHHNATLSLPFSDEWVTWNGSNEHLMSHTEFATFLEENSLDVVSPNGAELLEMCRDLQVKIDVNFSSSVRMGDTTSISYQKDNDATTKSNIALPVSIMISIPVYFGEPPVTMRAWLRRSISDGKLRLGYKLNRLEAVRQGEFNRVVSQIKSNIGDLTTVYGTK